MPVYMLSVELRFPPPEGASPEGVVAIGGDASPERLALAYSLGIFPWPHRDLPLLWFSPDPRFVLTFDNVHVGRSLRKRIRAAPFEMKADTAFEGVMAGCAEAMRPGQDGTWITPELRDGFLALHARGVAHSIESWAGGELMGGLYGVAIGRAFCGESMFARTDDASKIAMVTLLGNLKHWGFHFVDCQVYTDHLSRFGAQEWPRQHFLGALRRALSQPSAPGRWELALDPQASLDSLGLAAQSP
jgi:leucyl/phenylalanyl-tRNA--protein transferase